MIAQKSRFHPSFRDSLWSVGLATVEPSRASRDRHMAVVEPRGWQRTQIRVQCPCPCWQREGRG